MTIKEKEHLLKLARSAIENHLYTDGTDEGDVFPEATNQKRGVFVTLTKDGMLRGCIGYIEPIKFLYQAIPEMAVSAAFKDPRFSPLQQEELKNLEIEISILSPLKKISNIEEIVAGRDGLYIVRTFHSGLLLPQVAAEYGWDRKTFLAQTCCKAGLSADAWKSPQTAVYTFTAEIFGEK